MSLIVDALKSKYTQDPFNLEFAITRNCNSACLMCNQWKTQWKNELTFQEIDNIFQSYHGFKIVGITGGEPTLRDDLYAIARSIIITQPDLKRLFITTNGYLPGRLIHHLRQIVLWFRSYKQFRPDLQITVLISIDGPKEIHNKIRGKPFAYDMAVESIKQINEQFMPSYHDFLKMGSVSTYGPFNFKQYDQVLQELRDLRAKYNLEPAFCFVWYGNLYDTSPKDDQETKEYLDAVKNDRKKIMSFLQEGKSDLLDARSLFWEFSKSFADNTKKQVIPCEAAKVRYYLDSYGHVFPCIVWNKLVGDLRKNGYDFNKIIHGSERREIRKQIKRNECPICYLTCEFIPTMMAHPFQTIIHHLKGA